MPTTIHVQLNIDRGFSNPFTTARGIVLERLSVVAPDVERRLHAEPQTRFTVFTEAIDKNQAFLRVNILQDALVPVFQEALMKGATFGIEASTTGRIREVDQTSETFDHMAARALTVFRPRFLHLHFLTCTALTKDNAKVASPDLTAIFVGLAKRWRDNAENFEYTIFGESIQDFFNTLSQHLEKNVLIHRQSTTPSTVTISRGIKVYGFTGRLVVESIRDDIQSRKLAMLAMFASFAGVGISVSYGLGETRLSHLEFVQHGGSVGMKT